MEGAQPGPDLSAPLLRPTAAMTFSRGGALLRPQLIVAAAVLLIGIVIDLVDAFVVPTVVQHAAFVPLEAGPVRTVAGLALLVLAASAAAWALSVTTLRATAVVLGRGPRTADLVRAAARRWQFLAGWVAFAVVAVLAGTAAADASPSLPGYRILLVSVLVLLYPAPALLVFPAAIVHGIGWGPAWVRTREVIRRRDVRLTARDEVRVLVLVVVVVGAAVSWAAHLGADRLAPALGPVLTPVLGAMVDIAVVVGVATFVVVGLVRAWMRVVAQADGVAQVTLPAADDPRALRTGRGWLAVVALLLTPAVAPAVATWNPTPAPTIEVISAEVSAPQTAVVQDDGAVDLVGLASDQVVVCALDAVTCDRLNPTGPGSDRWSFVAATADPNGGIALVADRRQRGDSSRIELAIVTCTASTCGDDASYDAAVALGVGGISAELVAIDAVPGTYAALVPRIEAPDGGRERRVVDLVRCTDATCADREVTELGPVGGGGRTALRLADDGTAYVLVADPTREELSLLKVSPGMATPVTVAAVPLAGWEPGDHQGSGEGQEAFLLELDRGRPVALHHDPATGGLQLLACDDAACSTVTTADVDLPAEAAVAPNLVIDSTGHPLIAAFERGRGITVYSCLDPLCARTSSRLVALSNPPYDVQSEYDQPVPYLYLDSGERPFVLLQFPPGEGSADRFSADDVLLSCREQRCGM